MEIGKSLKGSIKDSILSLNNDNSLWFRNYKGIQDLINIDISRLVNTSMSNIISERLNKRLWR